MRSLPLAFAAASLALVAARAAAQPIGIVDQQNATGAVQNFVGRWTAAGQTFSPALDRIDAATFVLFTAGAAPTLQLSLYDGIGIGGALLGVSASRVVSTSDFRLVRFDLTSPVTLTPGGDYTLFLRALSGTFVGEYTVAPPYGYGGGDALDETGAVAPDADLVFAEGIEATVAPEPAALALTCAGALVLLVLARVSARSAAPERARRPGS